MAVINVDDIYILGETGAQVDKVTGLFTKDEGTTEEEKSFAQLNIGASGGGGGGRNLFDNPWFTVRQMGDGPFTGANTQTVDRWRAGSDTTVTGTSTGITMTVSSARWGILQRVEKDFLTVGKTYTISAMEQDGTITSASCVWAGSGLVRYPTGSDIGFEISVPSGEFNLIYITKATVGSVDLRAVKLEVGNVSTLENDSAPDYGEELLKCMQYFVRWWADPVGTAYISSSLNAAYMHINTGVHMRRIPTVSLSGALQVRVQGGTIGVSSIEAYTKLPTVGVTIKCNLSSSASVVSPASAYFNSTAHYIDLSTPF